MKKYHKNPRALTKKQFELLKRDLQELGDLSGIVHDINSDEIISGNQRSEIFDINMCKMEIIKEYETPTRTGTIAEGFVYYNDERFTYRKVDWTPEQCEKANVVANKAGGSWDMDILANMFDMENLMDWGFSEKELLELDFGIDKDGLTEDDNIPEDVETVCKTGDLWQLGNHRLLCGDATKEDDVKRLMNGKKADMVFTDPPFEMDNFKWFDLLKKDMPILIMHSDSNMIKLASKYIDIFHYFLIHYYSFGFARSKNMPQLAHHLIGLFGEVKFNCLKDGFKTVICEQLEFNKLMPYQKKVEIIDIILLHYSDKDNVILDLFGGSGTTMISCEKNDRRCLMVELNPSCCDIIIKRWSDYTSQKPKHLNQEA